MRKQLTSLNLAKNIVASFTVDVKKHPEFLIHQEGGGVYCDRNYLVSQAMLAIDELKKSL